ncbi:MAG: TSUP family transporter [Mogibacterium sp.]|nr:TSUP family transporter [Mogibacterium sp.]
MDIDILSLTGLIIIIAYVFAGIVDAVCGGGGLITVPVLMSVGMPPHMVVGTNLCTLLPGIWTSVYEFGKAGKINWKIGKMAVPAAIVGAALGSRLNLIMSDHYLKIVMVILIPVLAVFSVINRDIGEEDHSDELTHRQTVAGAVIIGFVVAVYHGFYGPASGMFYLIAFAGILKTDAVTANGITRLIFAFTNVITTIVFGMSGQLVWSVVLTGMVGYTIGNVIGSRLAIRKGAGIIRPVYYCVLAGLMIKMVTSLLA